MADLVRHWKSPQFFYPWYGQQFSCTLHHSCTRQTDIEAALPQRLIFALADSTRAVGVSNFVYSVQACGDYIHLASGFYSVMVSELHRLRAHAVVSYIETTTGSPHSFVHTSHAQLLPLSHLHTASPQTKNTRVQKAS
jgi:hypothetical protein